MNDGYLSTIEAAPTSNLVYSSFAAFADSGNGEIPGTWFTKALTHLGHSTASIRQTLYRMVLEKELFARKEGRTKFYRLSAYAKAEIDVGLKKIFRPPDENWDGTWTLVQYSFPESERTDRDRMRILLETMGFSALGQGLFAHSWDHQSAIQKTIEEMRVANRVRIFSAMPFGDDGAAKMVRENWDLRNLQNRYKGFIRKYSKLTTSRRAISDADAFILRFAVVLDFLNIAWGDPGLPGELLPANWQGFEARELAVKHYLKLLPGAQRYAISTGLSRDIVLKERISA